MIAQPLNEEKTILFTYVQIGIILSFGLTFSFAVQQIASLTIFNLVLIES